MSQCTVQKGGYASSLCEFIESIASVNAGKRAKGLFVHSMINVETKERLGVGVSIKTEERPHGVFLNYCPFCGGGLRDQERDGRNDEN